MRLIFEICIQIYFSDLSHLNAFQRYNGRTDDCPTVKDFGVYFERQLQAFLEATNKRGAVSALRSWAKVHYELHKATALPENFAAAVAELVTNSGRLRRDIARAAGIDDPDTVGDWMRGDRKPTDPDQVARVEKVLNLPPGTLSSNLDFSNRRRSFAIPKAWWPESWQKSYASSQHRRDKVIALIPEDVLTGPLDELRPEFVNALQRVLKRKGEPVYRQNAAVLKQKGYLFLFKNWPDPLKAEFSSLSAYKTAPNGFSNLERGEKWGERTAISARGQLGAFFGFLLLPADHPDPQLRGMGFSPESLTLAWLAVHEVVIGFLDFRLARAGAHSGGTETFINEFAALLNPKGGWLWLHPELLDQLPEQQQRQVEAAGGWKDHCEKVRLELRAALASLKRHGEIKKTRDPMLPIWPILDHPRPLSLINRALKLHRADLEARGQLHKLFSKNLAVAWRDHVLISIMARFPLRAQHWGLMTYKEDGTGYLQRPPRDGLQLVIPYDDFKNDFNESVFPRNSNERILTLKFSKVPLLTPLVPLVDFYIEHVRPILAGDGDLLFPTKWGKAVTANSLYVRVQTWSHEYLSKFSTRKLGIKGVFPFGPHAFRDIVATHIIKTKGLFSEAAYVLLDSEETVRRHYARFLPEDRVGLGMKGLESAFMTDEDDDL